MLKVGNRVEFVCGKQYKQTGTIEKKMPSHISIVNNEERSYAVYEVRLNNNVKVFAYGETLRKVKE